MHHIGDLNRFVYIKQNEFIVVNFQYVNIDYCEKFLEPNPKAYFNSFIKFSYPAIAKADRTHYFKFNFNYANIQTIINVNLNDYRQNLILLLKKRFDNYKINLSSNEIYVLLNSSLDRDAIPRIERRIEEVVDEFNRYNKNTFIPAQTTLFIENIAHKQYYYTINFY
jgi:hypothetical protein